MKSRTSFFNPTVFKKNMTRFAPVWIAYSIFMLLMMSTILGLDNECVRSLNAADRVTSMAGVNLIYAFVLAQLLFGDMYSARLCNALHALPLKRECWFVTNLVSALAFSIVPNLVVALISAPMLGQGWSIAFYWFAASFLEFLFFFGTAAFSAMLVGNRFAMVPVYVLVNFVSILAYWFAVKIYEPLLYGVRMSNDIFVRLCPTAQMMQFNQLLGLREYVPEEAASSVVLVGPNVTYATGDNPYFVVTGAGWGYTAICAVIGVALIAVALQLYRKRRLEAAGDFFAFKAVEPVFMVLFTLGMGGVFQLFADVFSLEMQYVFLAAGIVVGYYTGRMLLMRTTRVFQPKALIGLAAIAVVLAGSFGLMKVDAFGIVRNVPKIENVESVMFDGTYYFSVNGHHFEMTEPEDIQAVLDIHQDLVDNPTHSDAVTVQFLVEYTLKNGNTLTRYYDVDVNSEAGQALKGYYSSVEHVLNIEEEEIPAFLEALDYVWIMGEQYTKTEDPEFFEQYDIAGLVDAMVADCKAGNLAQDYEYHLEDEHGDVRFHIELEAEFGDYADYITVAVYECCENTLNWLKENGFDPGDYMG